MKYILYIFLFATLLCSCNMKESKFNEEYQELVEMYPTKFANGNAVTIYNANKEYILRSCWSKEGFGIEIYDLSKLDIEHKVYKLRGFKHENVGAGAQYEWLNAYIHEAIDNYTNYGESFLLIWPNGQQSPNLPKE